VPRFSQKMPIDMRKLKHNGLGFASGIEIIFDWHRRLMVLPEWH
jgi:hypothetical protein